eukprot:2663514-Rhodomonas_salina.4
MALSASLSAAPSIRESMIGVMVVIGWWWESAKNAPRLGSRAEGLDSAHLHYAPDTLAVHPQASGGPGIAGAVLTLRMPPPGDERRFQRRQWRNPLGLRSLCPGTKLGCLTAHLACDARFTSLHHACCYQAVSFGEQEEKSTASHTG